ncbi:Serine/threonine-protein kinase MARK2 [Grifola frondosa]|uniref:non-specific serine/threonine protein kinase n=1 Tax=Grifola frondosa TaxID=5627 RepID=A0A1C7MMV2_GRIFR|nr:Serine/threonine-protein kinase MARK2 [Grifola frondosa]
MSLWLHRTPARWISELSSQKIRVVGNYTLGKVIGEGTYGKVRLGVHRLTGTRVAIKQIPKAMSASLTREIHHHRQLHHPNVTQLYEVIATESSIWLVTELCSGGELFDYLAEKGRLSEDEARVLFGQLCLAVAYVHEKGIVHRDLKLENVLLDERCRVKLGDFGFTREFERGSLLETFCGTTGYASPEMLLAKKYLGPEVDVWSLGVILYTLLTGTLPFDDDDESIMKDKVIKGEYEDPEWLSQESRDLLRDILQTDPTKRLTIAQILEHPWFTIGASHLIRPISALSSQPPASRPTSPTPLRPPSPPVLPQPPSASSDSTFHSASCEFFSSTPTTPEDVSSHETHEEKVIRRNLSDSTIKKMAAHDLEHAMDVTHHPETVLEEADINQSPDVTPSRPSFSRATSNSNGSSKMPPAYPARTPARTKRRSVSSTLSEPSFEKSATPSPPQDYSSLLNTPAPIIFSTPLERELLNSMSQIGLDTGQIVHSVLTDACDATGALWWMLKRRAEKKALDEGDHNIVAFDMSEVHDEAKREIPHTDHVHKRKASSAGPSRESRSPIPPTLVPAHSAPELAFTPATPTVASTCRPKTPPRTVSPTNPLLSPSPSTTDSALRSHPSTPGEV